MRSIVRRNPIPLHYSASSTHLFFIENATDLGFVIANRHASALDFLVVVTCCHVGTMINLLEQSLTGFQRYRRRF